MWKNLYKEVMLSSLVEHLCFFLYRFVYYINAQKEKIFIGVRIMRKFSSYSIIGWEVGIEYHVVDLFVFNYKMKKYSNSAVDDPSIKIYGFRAEKKTIDDRNTKYQ
jgi:hypothetical protein